MGNQDKSSYKLKSPYNFVPLNADVYIPSWVKQISMDVPFSDGENGLVEVEMVNDTPLFIRNGVGASTSEKEKFSAHVTMPNGEKRYFLPGSSLKGMLRSVMEVLTFARLKEDFYNDDFYGFRSFDAKTSPLQPEYMKQMKMGIYCGWLRYDYQRDEYLLDDCGAYDENTCRIEIGKLRRECPLYCQVEKKGALEKNELLGYPVVKGRKLVCTGTMEKKKYEYLFGNVIEKNIHVSSEVIEKFKTVYKPSGYNKDNDGKQTLIKKLNSGDPIAVFYKKDGKGSVAILGLTRYFRYPYKYRISDCVRQHQMGDGHDLVDCIWGYVDKDEALKGRVHIGNAFADKTVDDAQLRSEAGVLGQPSASYYTFYLRQINKGKYMTYNDDDAEMAGRKRYRVHAPNALTTIPKGNGNENVMTTMKLLPPGLTFRFQISVHNLRPIEVGALLSALTFHGSKASYHNIGQGKSFGFGRLSIKKIELKGFQQEEQTYLKEFEWEMSKFYSINHPGELWANSEKVKSLLSIATEHDNASEMGLMELDEYKHFRNNANYTTLKEKSVAARALVSMKDVMEASNEVKKQAAERARAEAEGKAQTHADAIEKSVKVLISVDKCENAEDCDRNVAVLTQAIDDYEALEKEFGISSFDARVAELQKLKSDYLKQKITLLTEIANASNMVSSFEEHISKAFAIGTLSGKLKKWLKEAGQNAFNAEELETLRMHVVEHLPQDKAFKKEKKQWDTFDLKKSKGWQLLSAYVDAHVLQTWYDEMKESKA